MAKPIVFMVPEVSISAVDIMTVEVQMEALGTLAKASEVNDADDL
jgi:hypothetical protein